MRHLIRVLLWVGLVSLLWPADEAMAQMPVIDVAAVLQLVNQIKVLDQQLLQAKSEFDSITGDRGMQLLLEGTVRNYLPSNWQELTGAFEDARGAFGALSGEFTSLLAANAILTPQQMEHLAPAQRREVEAARRSAAMLQGLVRSALATTSERFDAIQSLITAIGLAKDQKAVLDLQARISAEQGMLANEGTKLSILYQTAQAEEWARKQREREQGIAGIGSLRELPALGLPVAED